MSKRGEFLLTTDHRPAVLEGYSPVDLGPSGFELGVRRGFGVATDRAQDQVTVFVGSGVAPPERMIAPFEKLDLAHHPSTSEAVRTLSEAVMAAIGHFAVVVISDSTAFLGTDFLATTPLFWTRTPKGLVVGTNLKDVAERGGRRELDDASAEEYLFTGVVTHPFTVIADVHRIEPGCVVVVEARGSGTSMANHSYWLPPSPRASVTTSEVRDLAEEFRELLVDQLRQLTSSRVSLLLSGGEDSRILAAMARRAGLEVEGLIFLDAINREYRKAARAAKLIGVDVTPRFREPGHYNSSLSSVLSEMGLDMDPRQVHSLGLIDAARDPLPALDGWYAALPKATFSPHRTPKWRGITIRRSRPIRPHSRDPAFFDRMRHRETVRERSVQKAARLGHLDERALAEWMPQWPATDQHTVAFFLSNQRNAWSLSPLVFRPLVDLAGSIPAELRLNRSFYKAAFSRSLGLAALVPRTDGEILGLPTALDVPYAALHQLVHRVVRRVARRQLPYPGPWPDVKSTWEADRAALFACPADSLGIVAQTSPAAAEIIDAARSAPPNTRRESLIRLRCALLAQYVSQLG